MLTALCFASVAATPELNWKVREQVTPEEVRRLEAEIVAATAGRPARLDLYAYGGPSRILLILERPGPFDSTRVNVRLPREPAPTWGALLGPAIASLLGPAATPDEPHDSDPPVVRTTSGPPILPIVLVGLSAASLGVGIAFDHQARQGARELTAGIEQPGGFEAKASNLERDAVVAQLLFTSAAVTVCAAVVLALVD